jgi:hypothetical protein
MLLFSDPEGIINPSSFILESSGCQCQDGKNHPLLQPNFSFLFPGKYSNATP